MMVRGLPFAEIIYCIVEETRKAVIYRLTVVYGKGKIIIVILE